MKKLLRALVHPVLLAILGLLAFSAVVWWIGPIVAVGSWKPMAAAWVRLTLIALVAAFVFGRMAWRSWRRRRAEQALAAGIAAAPPAPGEQDVQKIRESFAHAVATLRSQEHVSFWRRSQTLYDLPWYIFVGDAGSGKTTALLNAGLRFPLAAKLGQDKVELKGIGGTRNCDWWFTDEAVLIDTAGRYSTQQSDAAADAAGWHGFLALLKKHRPRRPINGVLLTIDAQSLMQQTPAERQQVAAQLRARMQELNDKLGIRAPVYVLVTKSDLIAGFDETFRHLGKEEREQAFGFSLPLQPQGDALETFDAEYEALVQRLCAQLIDRMQAERDLMVRAAIFSFPQQFAALRPLLGDMLRHLFAGPGRLDEPARVRGVYFTSGTQEGTPIDRMLGTLARAFGVEARARAALPGTGKSFFLHRVLRDVVFAEQGLVGFNRKAERRRSLLRGAGFATLAVCSAALLVGWAISSWRNDQHVDLVEARLPELRRTVDAVPQAGTGDVSGIAGSLSVVRAAAEPADFALDSPPLLNTLGLYQGEKLDQAAAAGYRNVLEHAMLPRLTVRSEELLRSATRNDLEFAYEALKSYLMLHLPPRFDAVALRSWVQYDWNQQLQGRLSVEQRARLDKHLDALLELGPPKRVPPMNQPLVDSVRQMLAALPTEERVYSRLKRMRLDQNLPEFTVARAAGPRAGQVFERASGAPLTSGIPALYTHAGYHEAFNPAIGKAVEEMRQEESWVLGIANNAPRSLPGSGTAPVVDAVRRLYLDDYIRIWDRYIADVRLVRLGDLERSVQIAALLASPDSPLTQYMRAVVRDTRLVKTEAPLPPAVGKLEQKADEAKNKIEQLLGGTPTSAPRPQGRPEQRVDDHFAALHRLTEGQPSGLEALQKKFEEILVHLQAVKGARLSKAPAPAGGPPVDTAALQPEPVRSMLLALANASRKESEDSDRKSLTSELRPIAEDCQRSIARRYPFATGSQADVLLVDFERLFGNGGTLDDFFQRRLATRVDKGTQPWSYRPLPDGTREPTPAAVADFQRASRIREVFFPQGAKAPGFRLDIRTLELSDGLTGLELDIDGQVHKLAAALPVTVTWPSARVDSEIRLTAQPGGAVQSFRGPWALFRLFDRYDAQPTQRPEKYQVLLNLDGRRAKLEVTAASVFHPYRLREMQQFRCPGAL